MVSGARVAGASAVVVSGSGAVVISAVVVSGSGAVVPGAAVLPCVRVGGFVYGCAVVSVPGSVPGVVSASEPPGVMTGSVPGTAVGSELPPHADSAVMTRPSSNIHTKTFFISAFQFP